MTTVFDELLSRFRAFLGGFGQQPVRDFSRDIDWSMPARKLEPRGLPCLAHLGRATAIAGEQASPLARLLVTAFTFRGDKVRIISARKASASERRGYLRR